MLHDPHTISEPILVLSGLTYLVPFSIALQNRRVYDSATYLFLTFTTVAFHSTRYDSFFALDCIAILNFILRSYIISTPLSPLTRGLFSFSIAYSLISYFIGQTYAAMSFHPDWNTQMAYHSFMHLSTSYASYRIMTDPMLEKIDA